MDEISIYDKGFDVVIILRKPFMKANFKDQKNSIEKLMQRIR